MNWVTFSVVFMIVTFLVVIGVDIFLLTRRCSATFSEVLRRAFYKWAPVVAIVSFGMGLLAGHFFWSDCDPDLLDQTIGEQCRRKYCLNSIAH